MSDGGHESVEQQQGLHPKPFVRRKRVCLFGTSADPPTGVGGHVGIVHALMKEQHHLRLDEIWIVPVYQHQFSSKRSRLLPFHHRYRMCQLAFEDITKPTRKDHDADNMQEEVLPLPKVLVSDCEKHCFAHMMAHREQERILDSSSLTTPGEQQQANTSSFTVGTADLLEYLLQKQQDESSDNNIDFIFCMGGDTFMDFTNWKWKRSKDVLHLLQGRIITFDRQGSTTPTDPDPMTSTSMERTMTTQFTDNDETQTDLSPNNTCSQAIMPSPLEERVHALNTNFGAQVCILPSSVMTLSHVSSTMVRSVQSISELKKLVSPQVAQYIVEHQLYGFAEQAETKQIL